jgi:putative phosphoribosyl transferase
MGAILQDDHLRDKRHVFSDRHDAGRQLVHFLRIHLSVHDPLVMAIPAGGVPVGAEIAGALGAHLTLAVVRKIQIPGNPEAGFGAVSWDGHVLINRPLLSALALSDEQVQTAIQKARKSVEGRVGRYCRSRPMIDPDGRSVLLTDDGLASGFTMLAALESIRARKPSRIIVAVPTASASSADQVSRYADELVCLNIRSGPWFAVAEAYRNWYDLTEDEVLQELACMRQDEPSGT